MEDDDDRVRHFAILSQYAVFKDIIPGYRIRVPTAAELATKVSKEVHRVRGQEAALLKSYQVRTGTIVAAGWLCFCRWGQYVLPHTTLQWYNNPLPWTLLGDFTHCAVSYKSHRNSVSK